MHQSSGVGRHIWNAWIYWLTFPRELLEFRPGLFTGCRVSTNWYVSSRWWFALNLKALNFGFSLGELAFSNNFEFYLSATLNACPVMMTVHIELLGDSVFSTTMLYLQERFWWWQREPLCGNEPFVLRLPSNIWRKYVHCCTWQLTRFRGRLGFDAVHGAQCRASRATLTPTLILSSPA